MTTSHASRPVNPEHLLLLATHMARALPGDALVLDDLLMQQVLQGQRKLSRSEFKALVGSPQTLSRMRFLASQHRARLAQQPDGAAGRLPGPQRSEGLLLAAADHGTDCTLMSADGLWALHALTTGRTTRLLLQLRRTDDAPEGTALRFDPEVTWAVLDGQGGTLLLGRLDDDGELQAVWDRPLDLRSHLAQGGGTWTVEPV